MPTNENNVPRSLPIPIGSRRRSGSVSDTSSSDSGSISPASPVQTPASGTLPRINAPISPSTSPILSYFLSQSPQSPSTTFPFRRGMAPPVYEEEEVFESEKPAQRHARSASAAAWPAGDKFPAPPAVPPPGHQQDRAAGIFRRLSLGGSMARPQMAVPKPANGHPQVAPRATTPPGMQSNAAGANTTPARKARRANTMASGTPRPPRAPSPMGERILKGHFDGFN